MGEPEQKLSENGILAGNYGDQILWLRLLFGYGY